MKKHKLLIVFVLLNTYVFAQYFPKPDNCHYYYKNEKIKLPINEKKFTIYFDLNKISKSTIKNTYEITKEVILSKERADSIYCCEVFIKILIMIVF